MSVERRRYFRIEDRALIKYRVIDDEALKDERRFVFLNEVKASNLHAALMGVDLRLQDLIDAARADSGPIADALELLNRKLTLLERVVAMESGPVALDSYREHEPITVSLSGGGVALTANEPLALNANLAIDLIILPSNHPIRIIGRVVDCRQDDTVGYAIGIEFEEMRDEDRDILIQHIIRKQSAELRERRQHEGDCAA